MDDRETVARIAIVSRAMKAFGIVDEERIKAVVDITSGIPWLVPPVRGEAYSPSPLFANAVARAALGKTFGAPGPGDIMQAAIDIAGTVRTDQGHVSQRKWVAEAMDPVKTLGLTENDLLKIGTGSPELRAIGGGR